MSSRPSAHSDISKVGAFVITTEPLSFVLTKQVGDFLLRVYQEGGAIHRMKLSKV